MYTHLEPKDLLNPQQMEVAVNGPDGATHLILCMGIAKLDFLDHETCAFLVGPCISRRQFVGAIASGTPITAHHTGEKNAAIGINDDLVLIEAIYDDDSCRVLVRAKVSSRVETKVAFAYNVNILAELPEF